ncbi:hypothetical protein RND71_034091 [Anisodus tanguticus]|uniref:Uncharacterized protein n=1 Tax=Anisodus tanguticus TaxID=243964 RepID=A0AAE1UY27_9SOLA|nr:hypothetical protein RND71_034091 [Anisodus tanguticus]
MDLFDEMAPHLDPNFIATIRKLFWQKRKLEKPRHEFYMIFIVLVTMSRKRKLQVTAKYYKN